jgi:M3 family oligoendopeptidase
MQLQDLTHFSAVDAAAPDMEAVAAEYEALLARLDAAEGEGALRAVIEDWGAMQRRDGTWSALAYLRFHQDTREASYVAARELADALDPKFKEFNAQVKRRLLAPGRRAEAAALVGEHALALWGCDLEAYSPQIEAHLIRESALSAEHTALLAGARVEFQGKTWRMSEMRRFLMDPDRAVRHGAERARWGWFLENAEALDGIYDGLVAERHAMAQKLGFEDFIPVGYKRMQRTDYDQRDVERFRAQVREELVPLVVALRERQRGALGVEALRWWDENLHGAEGNPQPQGDLEWIVAQTQGLFDELHPALAEFYAMMRSRGLMDLPSREGKAGGGFCTTLPSYGVPYIFANFIGNQDDVRVLIHELGHAFQCWSSRHVALPDQVWPTSEACEIHSMGLEHLVYGGLHHLFGGEAARYRQVHLTDALQFIPYGVAVDHFQHLVYASPGASAKERRQMWREVEAMYLPWRQYGDLEHLREGGFWHLQAHIFGMPFYYIDYTLASTCALQYWAWGQRDLAGALSSYVGLCARGGVAPFQALARGAGLTSPFDEGCLSEVIRTARAALEI